MLRTCADDPEFTFDIEKGEWKHVMFGLPERVLRMAVADESGDAHHFDIDLRPVQRGQTSLECVQLRHQCLMGDPGMGVDVLLVELRLVAVEVGAPSRDVMLSDIVLSHRKKGEGQAQHHSDASRDHDACPPNLLR